MEWTDVAQDRDKWQPVVNTVLDFRLHKMRGKLTILSRTTLVQEVSDLTRCTVR